MKKIISYLLILVMMLSLAACGSKSEKESNKETNKVVEEKVDAEEVLEKTIENFDSIKAMEAEVKLDAIGETAEEGKETVKGSVTLQVKNFLKVGMVVAMPIEATIPDSEPIEGALYWVDGYGYMDLMGSKMKLELPIDFAELENILTTETTEESTEEPTEEVTEEDKEKIKKMLNPEAKKDGSKYVIACELDWDEVIKMAEEEGTDTSSMKEIDVDECKFSITVNKDYVLEEVSMTMKFSGVAEGVNVSATVEATINFSTSNITIDLPDFSSYTDMSSMLGIPEEYDEI